jgi:hypothetical protein
MNDLNVTSEPVEINPASTYVSNEEFFEKSLFDDVFEMKSIQQVADKTAFFYLFIPERIS